MKLILKILIIFVITNSFCFGQENNGFSFEIPYNNDNAIINFFKLTNQKIDQLNLDKFENGFDSLGIRIWFNYPPEATGFSELIEIKYSESDWTGFYYPMKILPDNDHRTVTILESNKIPVNPKSGWDTLISKLNDLDIISLPLSYNTIIEKTDEETGKIKLSVVYHGKLIIVETATPLKYRFYEYYVPTAFANEYIEAKKMVDILNIIKSEFSVFDMKFRLRKKMIKNPATNK